MATKAFNLPQIAPDQAQKHIPANWSLDLIDVALARVVISAIKSAPPAAPAQGDAYIVPPGGRFGAVEPGAIAVWHAGEWHGFDLPIGARWNVSDEASERVRTETGWIKSPASGGSTSAFGMELRNATVDLAGKSVKAVGLIPARAIVLGVTSWTVAAVKGAPSYGVGLSGEATKFGGQLSVQKGGSNIGVVGPFASYAPVDVIVTATSGSFTAGKVGLQALLLVPPPAPV